MTKEEVLQLAKEAGFKLGEPFGIEHLSMLCGLVETKAKAEERRAVANAIESLGGDPKLAAMLRTRRY